MVIATDSDFLTDQFVQNSPENLAFGLGSMSWLAQEQSLAEIQLKQRQPRNLVFRDEKQIATLKYGNLALAAILPALMGGLYLYKRRTLKKFSYSSSQ